MKILLTEGAAEASSQTILVVPQGVGSSLETLSGDPVAKGLLAEADDKIVLSSVNAAGSARRDEFITPKDLMKDLTWLNKALGEYEVGSTIGLTPTPGGFKLDTSEAKRIDRAEGLRQGIAGGRLSRAYHYDAESAGEDGSLRLPLDPDHDPDNAALNEGIAQAQHELGRSRQDPAAKTVFLTLDQQAVIAACIADSEDVDLERVMASDQLWTTLRRLFPVALVPTSDDDGLIRIGLAEQPNP